MNRGVADAQDASSPTFVLLAIDSAGDPLNNNAPGAYATPGDASDPRALFDHPTTSELGAASFGTVAGQAITAADFEVPTELSLGGTTTWAARPWALLPAALRDRMRFFHHATYANAHAENINVRKFQGAIKGPGGVGVDSLPAVLAQETSGQLGTTVAVPVSIGGPAVQYQGRELRSLAPTQLQSLFSESGDVFGIPPSQFARLRDATLDAMYRQARSSGTHAQRQFIDAMSRSRRDAVQLGSELGALLTSITGDTVADQVIAASALFQRNVAPVVTMRIPFGGDNHNDSDLAEEVEGNVAGIEGIRLVWDELERQGLQDRVTFAYLNVFGRGMARNRQGGRNHNSDHHTMVMFGPHVRAGVTGGLSVETRGDGELRGARANAIADVPFEETLAAAGKTLLKAVGIPRAVYDERIVGGRAVE